MKRRVRIVMGLLGVLLLAGGWHFLRKRLRPTIAAPDAATLAQAARVRILRDKYGVPHVFGQSDADAAFGLAYANAEDDFPTIQLVLAAARGKLATLLTSKDALSNDYYVRLVARRRRRSTREYEQLAPATRALLDGYARGLNLYAFVHPDEVDSRLLPYSGRDVAAGFAHKLPLMLDLPGVLRALDAPSGEERRRPDRAGAPARGARLLRRRTATRWPRSARPTAARGSTSTRISPGKGRSPGTRRRWCRRRAGT